MHFIETHDSYKKKGDFFNFIISFLLYNYVEVKQNTHAVVFKSMFLTYTTVYRHYVVIY